MDDIKMTGLDSETLDRIKKNIMHLFPSPPKGDTSEKGPTNLEIYNQIYGDTGISEASKKNKISDLRSGKGISLNDIIKIAAWKGISLDWLILGKEPTAQTPPAPQESQTMAERLQEIAEKTEKEFPSNTVRGLLRGLMYLSFAKYIEDMKIEAHGHNYAYHNVNISFSIKPLERDGKLWQCDTVTYLTTGLRELSKFGLLDLPTKTPDDRALKAAAFKRILNAIPHNSYLTEYDPRSGFEVYWCYQGYACNNLDIPEKY